MTIFRPFFINIRGTCGAGKSHIVHVMRDELRPEPVFEVGRRRPVGYKVCGLGLFIVGHYEIAIGGIDTFKTLDDAYDVIDRWGARGYSILCEGKAQNRDTDYIIGRQRQFRIICVNLTTSQDEAVASVRARGHNIREDIIRRTWRKCQRDADTLRRGGVQVHDLNRDAAMKMVRNILR